jgi:hypothetical protein
MDKEVVYRALKGFGTYSSENYTAHLDRLDYGEQMEDLHGQYWYISPGVESYMVNPVTIPDLQEYYSQLPLLQSSPEKPASVQGSESATTSDIFAELPLELVQHITRFIPIESVNALQQVNPSVAAFTQTNSFWKERILQDMPWLYDLPERKNTGLDWARIYKELLLKSEKTEHIILGLANRRRIWLLCEQIAESYIALKQAKDSQKHSSLLDAVSDKMIKVGHLPGAKFEMSKLALFDDVEDVGKYESTLKVHWTREGYLLGFSVKTADSTHHHLGASNLVAARTDSVSIPEGDWLRGFVFISNDGIEYTYLCEEDIGRVVVGIELIFEHGDSLLLGQSKGDRRITQVAEGQLLVGLLAEWSQTGGIVRLSLLRHAEKVMPSSDSSKKVSIRTNKSLGSILWRNELPPPHLNISKSLVGYWASDFSVELNPHDAVVFGQNEAELAALTTISIDAQFGGLELGYADGSTKAYGPQRWGMSSFRIDGPGGERVTAVFMDVKTHPNGLRLVTNRKRQFTVGPNLAPGTNIIRSSARKVVCGLFCAWSEGRGTGQARMDSLGVMTFPGSYEPENNIGEEEDYQGPRDAAGLWWEPEAPPSSWREDGPVYGQHEQQTRWRTTQTKPGEYDVAHWFDLTRRVDNVRVTFTHGDKKLQNGMSLVSITLQYTDGSRASAGPDGFDGYSKACDDHKNERSEKKNEKEEKWPFCWCHYGFTDKQELAQAPHYRHDEFAVGGEYIQAIRLWTCPWLQGLQFVSTRGGGTEGPTWGVCKGEPTTILRFGQDTTTVGLKVGIADNERPTTYLDRIVFSLQALVKAPQ